MEDIQETLQRIMIKYNLDEYYPNFRKRMQAEKILKEFLAGREGRVACIASYSSDLALVRHFVGKRERGDYFLCRRAHNFEISYSTAYDVEKLATVDWTQYTTILLVSMEGASFIRHWFRQHGVAHTFLYDLFAEEGVVFDKDWNSLFSDPAMVWWANTAGDHAKQAFLTVELLAQLQNCRAATDEKERRLPLYKAYFLSLCAKDFILAQQCVARMGEEAVRQRASWREVEGLLAEIKEKLAMKMEKDILLLWTDALPYEDIHRVPFLEKKMAEGVCFDNIFTVCPNTHPTLKAMMCGKLPVDEDTYAIEEITEENSPLYRELRQHGYEICVIGEWSTIREDERSTCHHDVYEQSSIALWDLWRNILQHDGPVFFMVHTLQESHIPYLSPMLLDEEMDNEYLRFGKSCAYLSAQYEYYLPPLSKAMVKLYLTDHGKEWYMTRFHTYLVIEGEGIQPRRISSLCSFVDFYRIVADLLASNTVNDGHLQRDYVEVQDLDLYNPTYIATVMAQRYPLDIGHFGYHGFITNEYMYLRFTGGQEWFVKRGTHVPEPNLCDSFLCDEEKVEPFRALARDREQRMPPFREKLKYSRYLQEVFRRGKARNRKKKVLLDEWLESYPPGRLVLRTGGEYAGRLYSMLSNEARKRIGGVVDVNPHCLCSLLGLPIYSGLEDLPSSIEGVILAGRRTILDRLRAEAAPHEARIHILDPYRFLEGHGIICRYGVGEFEPADEDYEVGFPFDEVVY